MWSIVEREDVPIDPPGIRDAYIGYRGLMLREGRLTLDELNNLWREGVSTTYHGDDWGWRLIEDVLEVHTGVTTRYYKQDDHPERIDSPLAAYRAWGGHDAELISMILKELDAKEIPLAREQWHYLLTRAADDLKASESRP